MSVQNPIVNFIVMMRNALKEKHEEVIVPSSKLILTINKILKDEGFIEDFHIIEEKSFHKIKIILKYVNKKPVITNIQPVSTSGRRIYWKKDEVKKVRNGLGIAILSTSKGVMTDHKARLLGIGGEVICTVY